MEDETVNYESDYCKECGSCGESGCCRPDMCKIVQCEYGEANLRDYNMLNKQWDVMFTALTRISEGLSAPHLIAKSALEEVDSLFSMT